MSAGTLDVFTGIVDTDSAFTVLALGTSIWTLLRFTLAVYTAVTVSTDLARTIIFCTDTIFTDFTGLTSALDFGT